MRVWRLALGGGYVAFFLWLGIRDEEVIPGGMVVICGILVGLIAAVWLIASGLPKWIGGRDFARARRRAWFKLAGLGLVLTLVIALAAVAAAGISDERQASPGSAFLLWTALAIQWVYWLGWTWISWLFADRRTKRQFDARLSVSGQ